MFDTGSALMYVATDKCTNCPKDVKKYNTSKSQTFAASNQR